MKPQTSTPATAEQRYVRRVGAAIVIAARGADRRSISHAASGPPFAMMAR